MMNKDNENRMNDIEIYELLMATVHIISRTEYAKYFALKGGTVLISRLIENNRIDLFRRTSDIDVHCNRYEYWESFCKNIEMLLNSSNNGYRYKLIKRRNDSKPSCVSDSLQFDVHNVIGMKSTKIKIDMNVKGESGVELDFSGVLGMNIYSVQTAVADKVRALSSKAIYRRVKDMYDLSVYASIYALDYHKIKLALKKKYPDEQLTNMLIPQNMNELKHAYDKFDGIANKPTFGDLYYICQKFLHPIYKDVKYNLRWNTNSMAWERI